MFKYLQFQQTAFKSTTRVCCRMMSSANPKIYNFKDIKKLVEHPEKGKILIDVREPKELETYKMPTAINLPFQSSPSALSLPVDEFEETFHVSKPKDDQELVFFCLKGIRARSAEELARSYGFKKTGLYPGSITEWLAKGGDKVKPE